MGKTRVIPFVKSIKYTVVTVCYNAVDTLDRTILSVIGQTYDNIEYIIIDGGSTDGTVDIIKKYADCIDYWISEPDKGIYDAMNKGVKRATGNYIIFMNSGDSFTDNYVITDIACNIDGAPALIYGDWYERLNDSSVKKEPMPLSYLIKGMAFPHQSVFFKTDYHKHHLYNLKYKIAGDFDVIYSAFKNKEHFQYIHRAIAFYDVTPSNSTSLRNIKTLIREHLDILEVHGSKRKFIYLRELTKFRLHQFIKSILPESAVIGLKSVLNRKRHKSITSGK